MQAIYGLITSILTIILVSKNTNFITQIIPNTSSMDSKTQESIFIIAYVLGIVINFATPLIMTILISFILWIFFMIITESGNFREMFMIITQTYSLVIGVGVFKFLYVYFCVNKFTMSLEKKFLLFGRIDLMLLLVMVVGFFLYSNKNNISKYKKYAVLLLSLITFIFLQNLELLLK
ncbi:MAG: hypothetical protein LBC17_04790 [Lactobacillaceae bacterium]|jgi:hypothetical protein|nr:hypothetical protein [Lactobacillaceae bacterium]